ncbi:hypothetical protein M758_7G051900 [Ceratodon purpureus]|nr:hypothetical protein M758_7G051700 [Ceratodon purpureus]KAG0610266.1 hypothetical protein M758_7G051900 [Ceratodon purpureus]
MAAMSTAMAVAGSAVAAPATTLSSSAAFGPSSGVQQMGAVRSPASFNGSRMVAVRASQSSNEEQSPVKSKVLVALVAAGAALALNVAPVSPAHAGLFGSDNVKVERGATAPDFPGNEGTGNKVGANSGVRGSANSGTPLGEGAGGNLVGENQATRQASATGTPLGEGSLNTGSGVNLGEVLKVPEVPNPLSNVGELNPLKGGLPDASSVVGDAKSAAQSLVGDAKSKLPGGLPDASNVVGDAKDAAKNLAGDAKSKLPGGMPDAGSVASNAKDMAGDAKSKMSGNLPDPSSVASDAKNAAKDVAADAKSKLGGSSNVFGSAKDLAGDVASSDGATKAKDAAGEVAKNVEGAKSNLGLPNPMDAGKSLMSKVMGN